MPIRDATPVTHMSAAKVRIVTRSRILGAIDFEIKDPIGVLSACPIAGEKVKFAALNNRIAFL
jgi:hypothetical protein